MPNIPDISAWLLGAYSGSAPVLAGDFGSGQIGSIQIASGAFLPTMASRTLLGQTASNSGAILSVSGTGLYRVSTYVEIAQGGLLNVGTLSLRLDWTDSRQAQFVTPITGIALVTSGSFGQATTPIRAMSGSPIIMTVTLSSLTGNPQYNAYGTVERLI